MHSNEEHPSCADLDLKISKVVGLYVSDQQLYASTIAAIYKDRWQVKLFFKVIKQNLQIKTFVGLTTMA